MCPLLLHFPLLIVWIRQVLLPYFFAPPPMEAMTLNLQERRSSELVSLLSTALPASDGTILPLNQREREELSDHVRSGSSSKSNLCRGCLQAEGPGSVHRTVRDIDGAIHTLHIDIAGPFTSDGVAYYLVGALRLPGFPILIDVRLLISRSSVEVCDAIERMVAFFESLQIEGFCHHRLLKTGTSSQRSCW